MNSLSPCVKERRDGTAVCEKPAIYTAERCRGVVRYQCTNETCAMTLCGMHVVRSPRTPLKCPHCGALARTFTRRGKGGTA